MVCGNAKTHKFGESVPFGVVPASTVTAGLYVLCSTSTIGNSINLLICRQGPSVTTVAALSQLECRSKKEVAIDSFRYRGHLLLGSSLHHPSGLGCTEHLSEAVGTWAL